MEIVGENEIVCSICTEKITSNLLRLPCNSNHTFHRDCIIEWSQMPQNRVDVSCPNCREQLPQNIFHDLQKPFSWVDMIMLPLMLIFLVFQYIPVLLGESKRCWTWVTYCYTQLELAGLFLVNFIRFQLFNFILQAASYIWTQFLSISSFIITWSKTAVVRAWNFTTPIVIIASRDAINYLIPLLSAAQERIIALLIAFYRLTASAANRLINIIQDCTNYLINNFGSMKQRVFTHSRNIYLQLRQSTIDTSIWFQERIAPKIEIIKASIVMYFNLFVDNLLALSNSSINFARYYYNILADNLASLSNFLVDKFVLYWRILVVNSTLIFNSIINYSRRTLPLIYARIVEFIKSAILAIYNSNILAFLGKCVHLLIEAIKVVNFYGLKVNQFIIDIVRKLLDGKTYEKLTLLLNNFIHFAYDNILIASSYVKHALKVVAYVVYKCLRFVYRQCFRTVQFVNYYGLIVNAVIIRKANIVFSYFPSILSRISAVSYFIWQNLSSALTWLYVHTVSTTTIVYENLRIIGTWLYTNIQAISEFVFDNFIRVAFVKGRIVLSFLYDVSCQALVLIFRMILKISDVVWSAVMYLYDHLNNIKDGIRLVIDKVIEGTIWFGNMIYRAALVIFETLVFTLRFLYASLVFIFTTLNDGVMFLVNNVQRLPEFIAYLIIRPPCSICKIGYSKIGLLCFSCKLMTFWDLCSDCKIGFSKYKTKCFSCFLKQYFAFCRTCHRGFSKPGLNGLCITCKIDESFRRCNICREGWSKPFLHGICFLCRIKQLWDVCEGCHRGFKKLGDYCFQCYYNNLWSPCIACNSINYNRGYNKIGRYCFSCYFEDMDCIECKVKTKFQPCLTCRVDKYFPTCNQCKIGKSKIQEKCFACYFGRKCIVCKEGFAKIGALCFQCYLTKKCVTCNIGTQKISGQCLSCRLKYLFEK